MTRFLRTQDDRAGAPLVWIDFDAYARTVFAGGSGDWLADAPRRAAALTQAHGIVRSQVVAVDLGAPFVHAGADPFGAGAPAAYLETLLDALGHTLSGRADLVLALPSPRDLLVALGAPAGAAPSFDDLDDLSMAAAALLRRLSGKPVGGLLLRLSGRDAFDGELDNDELETMAPLIAAARYYGWAVAVEFAGVAAPGERAGEGLDADLLLYPDAAAAVLAARGDARFGGGLGAGYWSGALPALPVLPALYGAIPPSARPEDVVARMQALAAAFP